MGAPTKNQLVIVTGKGGVGRSSVSAALALEATRRGERVLLCEVNAQARAPALLGVDDEPREGLWELGGGLFTLNLRPRDSMREYALMKLRYETIYDAVFENRVVRAFLRLVPSLAETVMLGKLWYEVERRDDTGRPAWDRVILDAPATGHGVAFLRVPHVLLDTVPPGPMREDAERMRRTLCDPARTTLHIVTLPEEMPVNEAIELEGQVRDVLQISLGQLFLNCEVPPRFAPDEARRLEDAMGDALSPDVALPLTPAQTAAAAGHYQAQQATLSARYRRKLEVELPELPITGLPRLYSGAWGRPEIEQLSALLRSAG